MKTLKLKTLFFAFIIFFLASLQKAAAQKNDEKEIYNWFDDKIGRENAAINNGQVHINYDQTVKNKNRYLNSTLFNEGEVCYEGQNYYNVNLKYDIFKDVLILKPAGDSDYIGIELAKEKITRFSINEKKFINLNLNHKLPIDFQEGFYEENFIGKKFIFYIKYQKEQKTIIQNESVLIDYIEKNSYIVYIDNSFTKVNSKKDIVKLFPSIKNEINDFYLMNKNIEEENNIYFMKILVSYIDKKLTKQ